jgi:prephenate dehydrogenase
MNIAVIGLGLIGGSAALVLKERQPSLRIIGVDASKTHGEQALQLGIADELLPLPAAVEKADVVIVAVPVDATLPVLQQVLDICNWQVVIDMGSTKQVIMESIASNPRRGRYVAAHPMWGTEFSGPAAATAMAFTGKAAVICNAEESDADALDTAKDLLETLGLHLVYMNAADHDLHTAYISHISHITSFALANTVLEKEKEEGAIFELASAGFESTVRLAKSNPDMWLPIFRQNKENVLDVLNEHISQLRKFKACLEKENWEYLRELMVHANDIRRILK